MLTLSLVHMHTPALLCTARCIIFFGARLLPLQPDVYRAIATAVSLQVEEEEEEEEAAGPTLRISRRLARPTGCRRR